MGWYRRWNQKVYAESVFRKRPDGRYDFVYNGKFVWPYIVTAEQKDLIDRKLITPSGWTAVVVVLSILVTMVVVGYLRSPGFGSLLGFLLLVLVAAVLQLLIVWPLIWVRIFLRTAPRHPKPLYVRPPYPPKYDFSGMVTKAPELTLWAGMVICFGLDAVIAVLSLRDLMRGTLGGRLGPGCRRHGSALDGGTHLSAAMVGPPEGPGLGLDRQFDRSRRHQDQSQQNTGLPAVRSGFRCAIGLVRAVDGRPITYYKQ